MRMPVKKGAPRKIDISRDDILSICKRVTALGAKAQLLHDLLSEKPDQSSLKADGKTRVIESLPLIATWLSALQTDFENASLPPARATSRRAKK